MAKYKTTVGDATIVISDARITANEPKAHQKLNEAIVSDCGPYIPFQNGALRGSVRYPKGISGDIIEWNTPYAHYQYEGIVYGPNIPIKDAAGNITGWWSPPHKEPTSRRLTYHTEGTQDHWFERAKEENLDRWTQIVADALTED